MLRRFIDSLSESYAYVVMDNEAGMEHLSRRTTQNIDELLLISDHSIKGVRTIARLKELVAELELVVKRQSVIINFVPNEIDRHLSEELARLGIEPTATIPLDEEVYQYDLNLKPLLDLPDTSKAVMAVNDLMAGLLGLKRSIISYRAWLLCLSVRTRHLRSMSDRKRRHLKPWASTRKDMTCRLIPVSRNCWLLSTG